MTGRQSRGLLGARFSFGTVSLLFGLFHRPQSREAVPNGPPSDAPRGCICRVAGAHDESQ
jgi:hypothetical protein